jgi:hypothetical protein
VSDNAAAAPRVDALLARLARTASAGNQDLDCGPGWFPLLARLDADLAELAPDYVAEQVKEKLGGLRFYWDLPEGTHPAAGVRDAMAARVAAAELEAWQTCERCGATDDVAGSSAGRTRCAACHTAEAAPSDASPSTAYSLWVVRRHPAGAFGVVRAPDDDTVYDTPVDPAAQAFATVEDAAEWARQHDAEVDDGYDVHPECYVELRPAGEVEQLGQHMTVEWTDQVDPDTFRQVGIYRHNGVEYRCSCGPYDTCYCYEAALEAEVARLRALVDTLASGSLRLPDGA